MIDLTFMLNLTRQLAGSVRLVALSFFLWGIGEGLWWYIQPLYPIELGATPQQTGLALSLQGVGRLVAITPMALALRRYNAHTLMILGYIIGGIGVVCLAIAPAWQWTMVGYFTYGVSLSALIPTSIYIVQATRQDPTHNPDTSLQSVMTFTWAANAGGILISPLIGGFIGEYFSLRAVFLFSSFWFGLALLAAMRTPKFIQLPPEPARRPPSPQTSAKLIYLNSLFALIFIAGPLGFTFVPTYLEVDWGYSTQLLGILGMLSAAGMAFWSITLGKPRHAWQGFITGQGIAWIAFAFFIAWQGRLGFGIAYFLYGSWFALRPLANSLITLYIVEHQHNFAFSIIELLQAFGALVAPIMAGMLYVIDPLMPFWGALLLFSLTFILSHNRSRRIAYNVVHH